MSYTLMLTGAGIIVNILYLIGSACFFIGTLITLITRGH